MTKTAVILAAGLGSRLKALTKDKPKGFVKLNGEALIERSIKALLVAGIEHIYIGTGYLSSYYEALGNDYPQLSCIKNERYAESGSMYTLYNMRQHLSNSFLLLESDLLYDPAGLTNLLADSRTDIILASGETESEDEVYIETDKASYLINMSKQPMQLQHCDAELVGITKVSYETYQLMCQFAEQEFDNHLNIDYEYALVASAKQRPIYVKKVERFIWCEIDTVEHLARAQQLILPKLIQQQNTKPIVARKILLNPGPATTSDSVKMAQVVTDICPREQDFGRLMKWVGQQLTLFVGDLDRYETIMFGGSGTAAVEAVISSVVGDGQLLVVNNGAYGQRMLDIAQVYGINTVSFNQSSIVPLDLKGLEVEIVKHRQSLTHVAVVHNETTSGLLNNIEQIGQLCARYELTFIVDAMSSYGAIPISMADSYISYLVSSSNKNIQGMAGIGFVVANKKQLESIKNYSKKSYYLNLYDQYRYFNETGQLRFTPPVQTFYALEQAIVELQREGIAARYRRYSAVWDALILGIQQLGLTFHVPIEHHSKIITSIVEPELEGYNFNAMHDFLYERGITIYPGKIGLLSTFRIANIGAITVADIQLFLAALETYLTSLRSNKRLPL